MKIDDNYFKASELARLLKIIYIIAQLQWKDSSIQYSERNGPRLSLFLRGMVLIELDIIPRDLNMFQKDGEVIKYRKSNSIEEYIRDLCISLRDNDIYISLENIDYLMNTKPILINCSFLKLPNIKFELEKETVKGLISGIHDYTQLTLPKGKIKFSINNSNIYGDVYSYLTNNYSVCSYNRRFEYYKNVSISSITKEQFGYLSGFPELFPILEILFDIYRTDKIDSEIFYNSKTRRRDSIFIAKTDY